MHGVLALQRSLGNHATAAVLQRMKDVKSGTEVPLDDVGKMDISKLTELVGRLERGELTATEHERAQIRDRLLDIRQEAFAAEIAKLEPREIEELERQVEIEDLEAEIAQLEKGIADDEERERQQQVRAMSTPPSTPQLANLLATPLPTQSAPTLRVTAPSFTPSSLRVNAPSFTPRRPASRSSHRFRDQHRRVRKGPHGRPASCR